VIRPIASIAALALLALAPAAGAQPGPQGNTHPESPAVAESGAEMRNPFGPPVPPEHESGTVRQRVRAKIEFARQLDLDPLRDLAVFHATRVKILDTLARETVSTLTGKEAYEENLPGAPAADGSESEANEPIEHAFDPVFTLLDLIIDPMHYADRPLMHVGYLPLRREFIERSMPIPEGAGSEQAERIERERERFLRLTRITPLMVNEHLEPIVRAYEMSDPHRQAINKLNRSVRLWNEAAANLLVIAPESDADTWHHLADDYPPAAEARSIALELGEAWRARDAERVNELAARLAGVLPAINPEQYPGARRSLELAYNRADAFTWGYWLYALALVTLLLAFGTSRRWLMICGVGLLGLAVALHAFGFTARCVIAERFAIQNQFESMTGVSLFASIVAIGLLAWKRQALFGAAAAATGFLILVTATETGVPGASIGREAAILNTSVLLKYHVTTVLTSYGLIALGFVLSVFYLVAHYARKLRAADAVTPLLATATSDVALAGAGSGDGAGSRDGGGAAGDGSPRGAAAGSGVTASPTRLLRDLDKATMIVLQLAFWTLGVGILLGAWWADHSWGRWWAFDPKETWALVTWIIYLIVIHVRLVANNRGLVTAWLSIIGFIAMLWTYFGVNLLLPGLHAYA